MQWSPPPIARQAHRLAHPPSCLSGRTHYPRDEFPVQPWFALSRTGRKLGVLQGPWIRKPGDSGAGGPTSWGEIGDFGKSPSIQSGQHGSEVAFDRTESKDSFRSRQSHPSLLV